MGKYRELAFVNEKDVTTDWMESIFDSADVVKDRKTMVGFINHCVVTAHWADNVIIWEVSARLLTDYCYATLLLEQRLKEWEDDEQNVYSEIESIGNGKYGFIQSFFFKED